MTRDLYEEIDPRRVNLRKLCGGGITSSMESCVAAGVVPGNPDAIVIGDSKLGEASPLLIFERGELQNFVNAFNAGEI
ncbi:DUF397 domain-containing protein [Micromonospora sp. C51]|uniref:DUF397 domain-containing protein n=1 Tax=Micromonospora sp. C51 TaxID=2824879 RepID=UPI001B35E830|nr:DUF397 domain-containing protein [Micromonospora sp. C51]MBQ1047803.1 DUF397 domain-containing protein [Micromonospora sp. C51]